jgi:hypothetical protein
MTSSNIGKLTLTHALQDQNEENCKGESTHIRMDIFRNHNLKFFELGKPFCI